MYVADHIFIPEVAHFTSIPQYIYRLTAICAVLQWYLDFRLLLTRQSWLFNKTSAGQSSDPPPDHLGLKVVHEPTASPDDKSCTNIVFVHGLGGSAKGTWTLEPDSFWPAWLPKVRGLENCRIMTFGYDADWNKIWKPNNVLDISDFGDQLLNHLFLHDTVSFGT